MRILIFFIMLAIAACNNNKSSQEEVKVDSPKVKPAPAPLPVQPKTYSNARFRDVTVKRTHDYEIEVTGKAQIFEASFSWVIEDGHNEIQSGHTMADAGAPEWGNFKFHAMAVPKENAKLHLILFEISANDGSRQHELAIPLD